MTEKTYSQHIKARMRSVATRYIFGGLEGYKLLDSRYAKGAFTKRMPIGTGEEYPRKKKIYFNPNWIRRGISDPMLAFLLAHERSHIEQKEAAGDEFAATILGMKLLKMSRKQKEQLARQWYRQWWFSTPIISNKRFTDDFMKILGRGRK